MHCTEHRPFMASQARGIARGTKKAALAMAMKFLAAPFLMVVPSIMLGLRGISLKLAIVQLYKCIVFFDSIKELYYNSYYTNVEAIVNCDAGLFLVAHLGSNRISILLPARFIKHSIAHNWDDNSKCK
ncbi:hypothetical protein CDL12_09161 [Handroanthus impetiginosus]|uniref:Uncharacterized protein n=1 Tax=Handroanthus impetiginosus TaxID=429701 RepID=A0A2G9HKX9_9LAMI|nr:hypothetical protein CDL12_09161 [Handroanthus impetiginosus]